MNGPEPRYGLGYIGSQAGKNEADRIGALLSRLTQTHRNARDEWFVGKQIGVVQVASKRAGADCEKNVIHRRVGAFADRLNAFQFQLLGGDSAGRGHPAVERWCRGALEWQPHGLRIRLPGQACNAAADGQTGETERSAGAEEGSQSRSL